MPAVGEQCLSVRGIPHLHGPIVTGRGEVCAVMRPRHAEHSSCMSSIGERLLSLAETCIPHLYGVIGACRGNAHAIGRPRHAVHSIHMTMIAIRERECWQ